MAEWKKFTGSEEQLREIADAPNGWIVRFSNNKESSICTGEVNPYLIEKVLEYLICDPNRHAEKIKRWVDTGQPVYGRPSPDSEWVLVNDPVWNPLWQYTFDVPRKFIEVRDYLYKASDDEYWKRTVHKGQSSRQGWLVKGIEAMDGFVRWLDDDWKKVEL